jgi:GTP-binding protein
MEDEGVEEGVAEAHHSAHAPPLPPADAADGNLHAPSGHGRNFRPSLRLLADLSEDGATAVVARGGRGGRGNASLGQDTKGSQRDASEPGVKGGVTPLLLELKAVADVGLVGAPNVGKSTLLVRGRVVSSPQRLAHSSR